MFCVFPHVLVLRSFFQLFRKRIHLKIASLHSPCWKRSLKSSRIGFNAFIDKLNVSGWYTYRKDLMYFYLDMSTKKQENRDYLQIESRYLRNLSETIRKKCHFV